MYVGPWSVVLGARGCQGQAIPAVVETFGLCCREFSDLLRDLAKAAADNKNTPRGAFLSFWKSFLGAALWKGNAYYLARAAARVRREHMRVERERDPIERMQLEAVALGLFGEGVGQADVELPGGGAAGEGNDFWVGG